jgi:hypothetical protein
MTKAKLIEAMQEREAELWANYRKDREVFGEENSIARRSCAEWIAVYSLVDDLGLKIKLHVLDIED